MRLTRALCCAAAIMMLIAPAPSADEYNKLTYLTFSGPVQVPGAVLPAGTYMFKLADPESGRRVIQIWDQEGRKLYTTLLSIPDQLMEAKDEPVVLFTERPSGEPQAVKAWFYPADRYGYEFVYPKDQAMRIAQASHSSVLAQSETIKDDADVATRAGVTVGRVNETGQFEQGRTARAEPAPAPTPEPAQTQTPDPAPPAAPAPASATQPSANRTDAAATPSDDAAAPRTAETTPSPAPRATGTSGELPNTAGPLPLLGLLASLSLAGAIGVGRLRKRMSARDE